jgi:hypothetical protein
MNALPSRTNPLPALNQATDANKPSKIRDVVLLPKSAPPTYEDFANNGKTSAENLKVQRWEIHMREYSIATIPADGIGPEVIASSPCAGVLFPIGAATRKAGASRSTLSARPSAICRASATRIAGGAVSSRSTASSSGRRSRARKLSSPMPSP